VKVKKCVVLAHGLSVCPRQLWSQRTDALVQLLKLRFTQDGTWWLVLQAINQSSEQVDVLSFHGCELVVGLGYVSTRRARCVLLLFEVGRVFLLLFLHVCQRCGNCSCQLRIVFLIFLWCWCLLNWLGCGHL
jgi:hypothetical protein